MHLLKKPEQSKNPEHTGIISSTIDYNRSLSSPATVLTSPDNSEALPQRAVTDSIAKKEDSTQNNCREKPKISKPLILPTSFDFLGGGQSSKGQEVNDEEPVKVKPQGDSKVFVFTASSPSSPDLSSGRKNICADTLPSGQAGGDKIENDEKLAMLTQQLELGSDSVS